jgi:predicted PurR-regulated permease PerM
MTETPMQSFMHRPPRWFWWLLAIIGLIWFVSAIKSILLPFVVGLAIAYLLDPVTDRLEARKWPRWLATTLVLIVFFASILSIGFLIAPILQDQIGGIVRNLPRYIEQVRPFVMKLVAQAGGVENAKEILGSNTGKIVEFATKHIMEVIAGGLALFNFLSLVLISPVVAFYLLRDWDHLMARLDAWLPRSAEPTVKRLLGEADVALSGFVRGQTLVCLSLGVMYAIGWSLLGLQYGLLLGMLVGVLAFVPTVGPTFGMLLAMIIAIGQWGTAEPLKILGVFGVFLLTQAIEGGVLTPKLIGEKVGLHPVWVLFAVFAGATLMGFVGVFIAVPVAAVVAVVGRYLLERYLQSRYYSQ